MAATACSMQQMLKRGADQIDAAPSNESGSMFPVALLVRHHIERGCTEILDRFGRTLGPRPFAFEVDSARRLPADYDTCRDPKSLPSPHHNCPPGSNPQNQHSQEGDLLPQ
jgi:hypothetical protein